ncbi:MAG TPA: hypothetical protein VHM92_11785 [Allosphingosinicella sp.]|nr:hypothetical protein [Allosphingosinicella sp.]
MTAPAVLSAAELVTTPRWFPHMLDPLRDALLLVEKGEEEYRRAAFLDERSLSPDQARQAVDWRHVAAAFGPAARRDAQYIFHIGHVGSTLVSRLLGELPTFFSLREPLLLRVLADMAAEAGSDEALWSPKTLAARLDGAQALLSRTFRAEQRALVKATSAASEIAPGLVGPGSKALLLYARPERYGATILAGENSRRELAMASQERLKRLHRRSGGRRWRLWEMDEGARLGLAWAAEMTSLVQAVDALGPGAAMWLDFDAFLTDPSRALADVARGFGSPADAAAELARHPLMHRYSKATDHEYSASLRAELLTAASRDHADVLAAALAWLEEAARDVPAIARALDAAGRTR